MKKILITISSLLLLIPFMSNGQGVEDAIRYSTQFNQGSARTVAMGNAFTALGGDLGAITINPATTALYNCGEFSITPSITWNMDDIGFMPSSGVYRPAVSSGLKRKFSIPNVAFAYSLPTGLDRGLVSYSFGFALNKVNDFNHCYSFIEYDMGSSFLGSIASGLSGVSQADIDATDAYNNFDIPWKSLLAWDTYLIDKCGEPGFDYIGATENIYTDDAGYTTISTGNLNKDFLRETSGNVYNLAMNFGLNISDRFYAGANLNVFTVAYRENMTYGESAVYNEFQTGFREMQYNYNQETEGSGANVQLGFIWIPFSLLRIGATYTTPTLYELADSWGESMISRFDASSGYDSKEAYSPTGSYAYQVKAPGRFTLGTALVLGRTGLISMDYEYVNYGQTRMADERGDRRLFSDVNAYMKDNLSECSIIKLGAEYNLSNRTSIRGGWQSYVYQQPEYRVVSLGFGHNFSETSGIDVAYRMLSTRPYWQNVYDAYDGLQVPQMKVFPKSNQLMFTYKVKF
ncbi:MAG: hypothetical protein HUJ91_00680 [Bacteroidales bacterium]|nr:hypothetical protein [Bacteroidales bacterium]